VQLRRHAGLIEERFGPLQVTGQRLDAAVVEGLTTVAAGSARPPQTSSISACRSTARLIPRRAAGWLKGGTKPLRKKGTDRVLAFCCQTKSSPAGICSSWSRSMARPTRPETSAW